MFQLDPSSISGRLRVDMPVAVAKKLVIPQLPAFLQQYPGIELENQQQRSVSRRGPRGL